MKIHLVAIGEKMPAWVLAGYDEYARRLPRECSLLLRELPLATRGKTGDPLRWKREEAELIRAALPKGAYIVALDVLGKAWDTPELSRRLGVWMQEHADVVLLVGGPDGLDDTLLGEAHARWSLSPLTFPHPLVRVLLAEQVYRAWSLLNNHPYHRA
jgi:23S rRNA (pseudouridine1915-N3)-methyltransferase